MTTYANPVVVDVNEQTFQAEVLDRSHKVPVVVDFWAPWCGPCRTLGPTLEKLAAEAKGAFVLAKVNVDENQSLAAAFRVQGIPAVKAVRDGKVVSEFAGAQPESQVRAWLKPLVADEGDQLVEAAAVLEASDPDEAIARYRLALGDDPDNAAALFSLGRLLLMQGEDEGIASLRQVPAGTPFYDRAQALLPLADFFVAAEGDRDTPASQVASDTTNSAARYQIAALQARDQDYPNAMENLLAIVTRDRAFRDDGARKALLGLFVVVGDDNEIVVAYRRKLANALF